MMIMTVDSILAKQQAEAELCVEQTVPQVEVPGDLRQWVDPCTLAFWVKEEVLEVASCAVVRGGNKETQRMWELLTFSYVCGLYDPHQIAKSCATDPALQFLSSRQIPFAGEISRFRRTYRSVLHKLLARTIARAIADRTNDNPFIIHPQVLQNAQERLDTARHMENCD